MAALVFDTDKTKIKNGMTFNYLNEYYLKFGKDCIKLDYPFLPLFFKDVSPESIEMIYKSNGEPLLIDKKIKVKLEDVDRVYETNKAKIKDGMVFKMDDKYYLKIDDAYIRIDLFIDEKIIPFNKIVSVGILMIFDCKGFLLRKRR